MSMKAYEWFEFVEKILVELTNYAPLRALLLISMDVMNPFGISVLIPYPSGIPEKS